MLLTSKAGEDDEAVHDGKEEEGEKRKDLTSQHKPG